MEAIDDYTPTYEEFSSFIGKANVRSAGGYNGMNYCMLQNLPEELKVRIYDILVEAW